MKNATLTKVSELTGGETLISIEGGKTFLTDVDTSSAMPGLVVAETDFGTLYLDPDESVYVED